MANNTNYNVLLLEKKPVFFGTANGMPNTISWLEGIDKMELNKGILRCTYLVLSGVEYSLKTVNRKLNMECFEYKVCDVPINLMIKLGESKQYDLIKSIHYWLSNEKDELKKKGDETWQHLSDIEGFGVRYIKSTKNIKADTLLGYLDGVCALDISFLESVAIGFNSAYEGDGIGYRVSKVKTPQQHITAMNKIREDLYNQHIENAPIVIDKFIENMKEGERD